MPAVIPLKDLAPPPQIQSELLRRIFGWSMDLKTVLTVCLGYIVAVQVANKANAARQPRKSGRKQWTLFELLVVLHNVALCIFSAVTFRGILGTLVRNFSSRPVREALCDLDRRWANDGAAFWIWVFYISKYYELLDTAILLGKGRQSSFLQTFHHSGSILSMWLQSAAQLSFGWIFVLFNSFIHTIMYAYYALTCFGYTPAWKRWLTRLQIAQFVIGDPIGVLYLVIPNCCPPDERVVDIIGGWVVPFTRFRYWAGYVTMVFVAALVLLFLDFSRKTYDAGGEQRAPRPPGKRR